MLGAKPLSSFSEGTDAAQICDRLYDDIRDSTIGMHPWTFSFKKTQLARTTTTPVNEFKYEYQLPGDRLNNVRAVFTSGTSGARPIQYGWEVMGDKLLSSEEEIYVDYQYPTPEAELPTYFIQLLKYMMAWNIAETVTDQITKADYFKTQAVGTPSENMRGGFFRVATSIDSQNRQTEAIEDYSLISVRG
tara:strand:+ start:3146 stop:3715 length:570 start_codon:yes stop_codon:yes gene_type:complete